MSQTIAAIATPPAPSAIGILRLSGDGAIEAAAAVFRPAGGKSLAEYESRRLVYGTLLSIQIEAVPAPSSIFFACHCQHFERPLFLLTLTVPLSSPEAL